MADDGQRKHLPNSCKSEETFQRTQETQVERKFPNRTTGIVSLPPGSRGPKSLYIKRKGDSFGFTLRHFIIYPPDGLTDEDDGRLAAIGALHTPMETIFVRKVKNHGPAQQAGLQRGDRIVSVNTIQVIDKPYSQVIQLIQSSPVYLHLLVVPKEEDALQRHFTETAYNPVSNQDFPLETPRDRRSAQQFLTHTFNQKPGEFQVDAQSWRCLRYPFEVQVPRIEKRHSSYDKSKRSADDLKSNLQVELQRVRNEIFTEIQTHDITPRQSCRAQPQVPIYKEMGRRASEGNALDEREHYYDLPEFSSLVSDDEMVLSNPRMKTMYKHNYLSDNASQTSANMSLLTYPSSAGCRLSLDDSRRESSSSLTSSYADGSKDSLYSYDSASTLTGQETDDSAILSRFRKNFRQKEEFLKMPTNTIEPILIQREFYGRPKKLEKSMWPPNEPIRQDSPSRTKPIHQNFQRVKNDIEIERDFVLQSQIQPSALVTPIQKQTKKSKPPPLTTLDYIQEAPSSIYSTDGFVNGAFVDDSDDKRVQSPTSQIVHTRAKQFESGKLSLSDDPLSTDRTSFYKSELARISSKRVVPNVTERAQEYETRNVEPRRDTSGTSTNSGNSVTKRIQRDSRSLDSSEMLADGAFQMRVRSNSAESWIGTQGEKAFKGAIINRQDAVEDHSTKFSVAQDNFPVVVKRRIKNTNLAEDDRIMRRESYLKATEGSRMNFECDLSDGDVSPKALRSMHRRWRPPVFPGDIQQLRKLFEDAASSLGGSISGNSSSSASLDREKGASSPLEKDQHITREGYLNCKITEIDGKRPGARSWKQVWAILRGSKLYLYKDRNHQSPIGSSDLVDQSFSGGVDIRTSLVRVAEDYTKRKHVFRLSSRTPCRSELLLQAETGDELTDWVKILKEQVVVTGDVDKNSEPTQGAQLAVPQTVAAVTSIQIQDSRLSPQPYKSKITYGRNRSPTGQSPVNKTRKPSQQPCDPSTSPKTKTWRGRVVKQFRKIQGANSPNSPTAPEGSTFGAPLDHCLSSANNQYIPKFVEVCTEIVEEKGLQVIGIYRVPGNNASITALSEEVNRNYVDISLDDPRWGDVHVVSSLLKSFFRKLPDSLVTNELYPSFIKADKIQDPKLRLEEFKRLIRNLPHHNYYTLKHLVFHLNKVMANSEINKMDAKNVAIVFGPNIVRPEEESMQDMVSNNSHQCKILVTFLNYANWLFSSEDDCELDLSTIREVYEESDANNHQALLDSINKLEALPTPKEKNGALLSSLISAAQRKVKRKPKISSSLGDTNKDEQTSPNETRSLPLLSSQFSPTDLKDNTLESRKSHEIPTTVRDVETCGKQTKVKVTWFNYVTDQKNFEERVQHFEEETKANLTRPRLLAITQGTGQSANLSTSAGNVNHHTTRLPVQHNDPHVITKTHSASNVFSSKTAFTIDNRNSLSSIDDSSSSVQYSKHFSGKNNGDGVRGVRYSATQQYADYINSNRNDNANREAKTGAMSFARDGSIRERRMGARSGSAENVNSSSLDVNSNGSMKKVKYENQDEECNRKVGTPELMNKSHSTDDDTDLVAAMTKLYDKKLEDYTQPNILTGEGLPFADESPERTNRENNNSYFDKENIPRGNDLYKNPSLHKNHYPNCNFKSKREEIKLKESNIEQEKDVDSSTTKDRVPDNERHLATHKITLSNGTIKINSATGSKLKRSESLNKPDHTVPPNNKIKRSESLNKTSDNKLKRTDSLTKNEKTESNISKKRELLNVKKTKELKRKNGMPDRSIKRRHTVGGTKDPDKVTWLDKYQEEISCTKENKEKCMRTSSPDLSSTRRDRLLLEINLFELGDMVVALRPHLLGARPQSFPESTVYKVPLESHV